MNSLFYELVRVALGAQESLSRLPSEEGWEALLDMADRQSLLGVCFVGIRRLGADSDDGFSRIGMSEDLYLEWMGLAVRINMENEAMDGYTKKVLAHFRKEGFACTVLKGQGIAALYGPLQEFRQCGDVDVWVSGGRKKLYEQSLRMFGHLEGLTYHHIHYPMYNDPEVEAHVWPTFLSSPLRNRRLQRFCRMHEPEEGCNDAPSLAFNRVYILLHCHQHFTRRGVGMRQLLDYYFVLQQGFTGQEREESMKWIRALGMKRFAGAVMWVMRDVFALDARYLLCEPDRTYGQFLLEEVMQTGNMGYADARVDRKRLQSAAGRYLSNLQRDFRIAKVCPHEALWEPLWGIYQFAWCKLTGWKYKQ